MRAASHDASTAATCISPIHVSARPSCVIACQSSEPSTPVASACAVKKVMWFGSYKARGVAGSRKRVPLPARPPYLCDRMIRIDQLTKAFKGKPALRGISLQIDRGEIYGLLGHNGAGKSTTFGIMLGQVYPDSGEVFIDGISVQRQRSQALARVGAIFEAPGFYNYLSGWRNLEILTSYSARVPAATLREAVEVVGLTAAHSRQSRDLLARHAPAARARAGAPPHAGAGDARRADRGPRPRRHSRNP